MESNDINRLSKIIKYNDFNDCIINEFLFEYFTSSLEISLKTKSLAN